MPARTRFSLSALALCLDLGQGVTVTAVDPTGEFIDLTMEGVIIDGAPAEGDVVAEYLIGSDERRSFVQFRAAASPPAEDAGQVDETTPPSGPGSRGGRTRGGS